METAWKVQRKQGRQGDSDEWLLLKNTELQLNIHQKKFELALVIAKILMRRKVSTSSLANLSVALQWTGKKGSNEGFKASIRNVESE